MEPAARRRPHGVRDLPPREDLLRPSFWIRDRNRLEQRPGVRMFWVRVDRPRRTHLDDPAEIHDGDPIAHELRGREVMRDEKVRKLVPGLQVHQKLKDSRANRHVEHSDRLVGDDKLWSQRDYAGSDYPLFLATAELVGILVVEERGRPKSDVVEHLVYCLAQRLLRLRPNAFPVLRGKTMGPQHVSDRLTGRHGRAQGCVSVLVDQLDLFSKTKEGPLVWARDVLPVEQDLSGRRAYEPDQGLRDRGLSAAALSHEAEDFPRVD